MSALLPLWPWVALVVTLYLVAAAAETYPEDSEPDPLSGPRGCVMGALIVVAAMLTLIGLWGLMT